MDDNTRPHRAIVTKRYLQQETIELVSKDSGPKGPYSDGTSL